MFAKTTKRNIGAWCSEIVRVHLQSGSRRGRELKVNLEEIWPTGALFLTSTRIPSLTRLRFRCWDYEYHGEVIARKFSKSLGYFVEMRFDSGCRWTEQQYRPRHFFNPLVLLANRIFEATLRDPGDTQGSLTRPLSFAAAVSCSKHAAPSTAALGASYHVAQRISF